MNNKTIENKVEQILITKLITNISLSTYLTINIKKEEILGIYIYGSRLWKIDNEKSDLDYVIIISDNSDIWKYQNSKKDQYEEKGYILNESEDIDLHILSETKYKEMVNKANELALSIYYQENPILKYNFNLELKKDKTKLHNYLVSLRKSFSTKANNSYVKSKKKLTIEKNLILSVKSMFHSLRLLDFGYHIAKYEIEKSTQNIEKNKLLFDIEEITKNYKKELKELHILFSSNNWEEIHQLMKPKFNKKASLFKKIAPKN